MMKTVLKISVASAMALAALGLTSCDPQAFSMNIEMSYPSKSGLSLTGKSIAVFCLDSGESKDSVFTDYLLNGFASTIEKNYFAGQQSVNLYKVKKQPGDNYSSVDSLSALVMKSGDDVVFLFDAPEFGNVSILDKEVSASDTALFYTASVPMILKLYAYDSMGKVDTVYAWSGSRELKSTVSVDVYTPRTAVPDMVWTSLNKQAESAGALSAKIFAPVWKSEQFTLLYYESPSDWDNASQLAYDFKWKEAISVWMKLVNTNNLMRRSCAEYDIALGCFMLGDNDLALKWLNQSDKDYPISLSSGLRKRINSRK